MRDNGGEVEARGHPGDDPVWQLHPVWDATDRKRMARTANHIVRETEQARESWGDALPSGAVVIAGNGTGDLLLVLPDGDDVVWWDHESGDAAAVEVGWGLIRPAR